MKSRWVIHQIGYFCVALLKTFVHLERKTKKLEFQAREFVHLITTPEMHSNYIASLLSQLSYIVNLNSYRNSCFFAGLSTVSFNRQIRLHS